MRADIGTGGDQWRPHSNTAIPKKQSTLGSRETRGLVICVTGFTGHRRSRYTLAVVAGVVGADLPARIVLVLGLANLVADGFAMAAGIILALQADRDDYDRLLAVERKHIAVVPDGEREEIRQIFVARVSRATSLSE